MIADQSLRSILEQEVKAFGTLYTGHALMAQIVLKHGVEGRGIAHSEPPGTPKECFSNAAHRAMDNPLRFTYVEGFAMRDKMFIPILHAWLVDRRGRVIDVTWDRPEDCQYIGIKFRKAVLLKELLRNEVYGLLDLGGNLNMPLLRRIDPELVSEFERKAKERRKQHA